MTTHEGTTGRDRDPRGRPRNARPRDAFGRPLPRGAAGVERVPEDLSLSPEGTLQEAQRLIDAELPFHAHEVLEAAWKSAPDDERDLWQGLAQLAVGLTHIQRGNAKGAVALLRRGAARIAPYAGPAGPHEGRQGAASAAPRVGAAPHVGAAPYAGTAPHGVDAAGVVRHAEDLADRIERSGVTGIRAGDLRPLLRG